MLIKSTSIFALGYAVAQVSATCTSADLREVLLDESNGWADGTSITFPEDGEQFFNVTQRWSAYAEPTFAAAISPSCESDVLQAVRLALRNEINFLATGGRHSVVPTLQRLQEGLAIDMSNMNTVEIDREARTLTVGGGVRTSEVLGPISDAGLEIPTGTCSCTGFVGVTLGGGANPWVANEGMVSDALLSVRMITAAGELIEVSEDSYPDLFWALRGAGTNFGIVTSATYQLHEPTNNNEILVVDMAFPPQANVSYFNAIEAMSRNQSSLLGATTMMQFNPEAGAAMIVGSYMWFGPREEGFAALQPLLSLNPANIHNQTVTWEHLVGAIAGGSDEQVCIPGTVRNTYSMYGRHVSAAMLTRSFARLTNYYHEHPTAAQSASVFRHRGRGRADETIPLDATAYGWRDQGASMELIISNEPGDTAAEDAGNALGRAIREDFVVSSGFGRLAVHVNMARDTDSLEDIYNERHLPRLASLKATWDPNNVFRFHHPLPTSYP